MLSRDATKKRGTSKKKMQKIKTMIENVRQAKLFSKNIYIQNEMQQQVETITGELSIERIHIFIIIRRNLY